MSERTLSDVEGALKPLRRRLQLRRLGYVTGAAAALLLAVIIGSTQVPIPKQHEFLVLLLMATIGALGLALLLSAWTIGKLRVAIEFFELAYADWVEAHHENYFLRRVVGIGGEPLERCPHMERVNLQKFVRKMKEEYARIKSECGRDEVMFMQRWRNFVDAAMEKFGQNFAFAAARIGAGKIGVSNYAITVACRQCQLDFDPSRYLIDLYGLRKKEEEKELSTGW